MSSSSSTAKEPQVDSDLEDTTPDKHVCLLCGKSYKSTKTLCNHRAACHDNSTRIHPLQCTWCATSFESRIVLSNHLGKCSGLDDAVYPLSCPHCDESCSAVQDLRRHSQSCKAWKIDTSSEDKTMVDFEAELSNVSKHPGTPQRYREFAQPVELRLENGERAFALVLGGPKRIQEDSVAFVRPLKRHCPQDIEDMDLKSALRRHPYGRLVRPEDYKVAEGSDDLWDVPFAGNGKMIARMMSGLLIQSGDAVLLAIKVELYGRRPSEDTHCQELAMPGRSPYVAVNSLHDNSNKVMVGTPGWNILVTLAVDLTTGKIVVGPHNPNFVPHRRSHIWLRTDGGQDRHNNLERQTCSKFDSNSTFEKYASVWPQFNYYRVLPVTLTSLWYFKSEAQWSGVKTAAFVFHRLYEKQELLKSDIVEAINKSRGPKNTPCEILKILDKLVREMDDGITAPVSPTVNELLTQLSGKIQTDISTLNNEEITQAVEQRICQFIREDSE
ncbi:hypothetical protein B0O80DRAFT_248289 [Mortierella sp. GBAus27b]|nr:hypothetical protein B0O80DRAFT_248289 [Mortierella sp. GBAus27b]